MSREILEFQILLSFKTKILLLENMFQNVFLLNCVWVWYKELWHKELVVAGLCHRKFLFVCFFFLPFFTPRIFMVFLFNTLLSFPQYVPTACDLFSKCGILTVAPCKLFLLYSYSTILREIISDRTGILTFLFKVCILYIS